MFDEVIYYYSGDIISGAYERREGAFNCVCRAAYSILKSIRSFHDHIRVTIG